MADTPKADKTEREEIRARMLARLAGLREPIRSAASFAGHRAFRLGGEALSVLMALGIAVLFFVSGLAARQSADLSALRVNFQTWFSQSFEGASAGLGDLELRWNPADETVTFTVSDVTVYDEAGDVVQTLPLLRATTRQADLLGRRASLRDVEIVGGVVTYLRREDGTVMAGLGSPETVGRVGPVYHGQQSGSGMTFDLAWLEDFSSLTLRESRAYIADEADDLRIALDIAELNGLRNDRRLRLDLDGRILPDPSINDVDAERENDAGALRLYLRSEDGLETLDVELETTSLQPDRIAPSRGRLAAFGSLAMPVDTALTALYSRSGGLLAANVSLSAGPGTARFAGEDRTVESATFVGGLRPGDEVMRVESVTLASERLDLSGSGVMREMGRLYDGDIGTSPKFDLDFSDARFDLTPIFQRPVTIDAMSAVGEIDIDTRTLTLDSVEAAFGQTALELSGRMATNDDGVSQVALSGRTTSSMTAEELLAVWPVDAADGARRWIDRSVLDGSIHNVRFAIDLDEAFFAEPALDSDRLQLDFDVRDGVVRYISTMEVLEEAVGSGRIDGNRLGFVLQQGRIGDVDIIGGDVDIPRLMPKGGDILITAQARGEAPDLLELINQPPFQYLDKYGVDPAGFTGDADVTISIKRPLLEFFDENRIEYSVDGTFRNASAPFSLGAYTLSDADVTVTGGKDGLFMEGSANLGPWRADLAWEERYGQGGEPTRYRISGPMDQKTLDGFGFGFRQLFGGTLDIEIEASGQGLDVRDALIDIGLDQAEMSFGDIWSKGAGDAGQLRINLIRSEAGISLEDVLLKAPGLDLAGQAHLRTDLSLEEARLDRLVVDGLIDGRVVLSRDPEVQRLALDASGARLDLSAFVERALQSAGGESTNLPLSVDAAFNEIVLAKGYGLENGVMTYRHNGEAVERMSLRGIRPDGPFAMTLSGSDDARQRRAELTVPDISEAASAVLGLSSTTGGSLLIGADMPAIGETGPIIGNAEMRDFTVRDAPFLAQILSLASLTGMLDTLSGEGLAFDELVFDFGLQNRRLSLRDAKMRGPAIGMTGEGDIALDARTIDFSGTLVPAYTANSLLGDIPLIGDIFVGKDGEGVFAVTYGVAGPFSQAQISINPLSALTPGFIRGIFRESRDDLPDSVIEDIEAVRPDGGAED